MDAHDIAKYWITGKRNEVCCQTCRTRRVSEPRVFRIELVQESSLPTGVDAQ
jgi:hypothetical protein